MAKRMSRAEIRRQRQALVDSRSERPALPAVLASRAESFQPTSIDDDTWHRVRPVFLAIIAQSSTRGPEAFSKRCIALAAYLAWADSESIELSVPTLMRYEQIDEFSRTLTSASAATRRSHLRSLATDSNPSGVPPRGVTYSHNPVREPYTAQEMAAIRRLAVNQPTPTSKRTMCAVVGLGRGAGLDSQDLRYLTRSDIEDRGADGIWVDVPGPRPRLVPVRRDWEDLVQIGIDRIKPADLVIGNTPSRRNVASKVFEKAVVLGSAPPLDASRLRTTWLADLLISEVPFTVVMAVSGLKSARTLIEILDHLGLTPERTSAR